MTLAMTIGPAVLILGMGLLGALRDLPRGILALTGVLFGVALVNLWAEPLALDLSRRLSNPDTALLLRVASIALFSTVALVLGLGSGLLLPKIVGATLATRAAGALLGAFTGALACGYLLVYATHENSAFLKQVADSPIASVLQARLPLLLALGAGIIAFAVVLRMLVSLFLRRAAHTVPSTAPAAPAQGRQEIDRQIADKIRERTR